MLEYRNSARGHLMALEDKSAMEGYLETMMQGTIRPLENPDGARSEEQVPSSSGKNTRRDDGQGGSRRSEEPMQQDPDRA